MHVVLCVVVVGMVVVVVVVVVACVSVVVGSGILWWSKKLTPYLFAHATRIETQTKKQYQRKPWYRCALYAFVWQK